MRAIVTKERAAVSLLFLMNGTMAGCWAVKVPQFSSALSLSEFELGLMILTLGLGSIVFMPIAGASISRFGSRAVALATSLMFVPMLLVLTLAPNVMTAVPAIFLFGGFMGAMDVAMNANAVETETHMGRAIMSSCHAFWSLGGLAGAGLGGWLLTISTPILHALVSTFLAAALLLLAWPYLYRDAPHHHSDHTPRSGLPRTAAPWLLGIIALFSMIPEGSVLDWSALYLRKELHTDVAASGLAYAGFSLTMALMRFAGDHLRDRLGAILILRLSAAIAMSGLLLAGFAAGPLMAIAGFALMGIGIANLVPIAFSAAGKLPGLAPGIGLSVVTTMGYCGILIAPSLIGFIASHASLGLVFKALPVLLVVVLLLSGQARHADRQDEDRHAVDIEA
ncbi:MFS transporter [Allorhizobium sp. BGMRC 0089]|uniref:MFS transporter n=1 Tax=Allorhizobium sonneratiae TaxID=2934936 RepID=UPI0020340187|nr:MFS transporter [Allorhizobium sonneratiae]MCM2294363.1 MFS transporter [Allorhizobium sonneratiae]